MSGRSFRSVFMVASCAGAALGCYLVSLRVASERAALEAVETRIVLAQRDMRVLQTEIGTRGRLAQLERWNVKVLALSAPSADQFLRGGFELARLTQPEQKVDFQAPVVLASAPAPGPRTAPVGDAGASDASTAALPTRALLHEASLTTQTREVPARAAVALPLQAEPKSKDKPVTAAKPALPKSKDTPGLAAAKSSSAPADKPVAKKSVDKPSTASAKPMTKPVRVAKVDPLEPLPARHSDKPKDSAAAR